MSEEQTKRGWRFWTAIGMAGLALYATSIGPASLIAREKNLRVLYAPIYFVTDSSPKAVRVALRDYLNFFSGSPNLVRLHP